MSPDRTSERLVATAVAGAIALNFPFLYLCSGGRAVLGIPALFLYLFIVWPALIALVALIIRGHRGEPPGD
jgi:hypothetical protein